MNDNPDVVDKKNFVARDVQPTVLRLHPEMRAALMRLANINGRSLSKEIAQRLERSLEADPVPQSYKAPNLTTRHITQEDKGPADPLTETDRAMLAVFRQLPVDKQLALLSLFR